MERFAAARIAVATLAALVTFTVTGPGARPAEAAAVADSCLGQCADILPPGENGNATLTDIALFKTLGIRPAHSEDQLDRYANLLNAYTGLTDAQIGQFYNDSSLGVPAAQIGRIEQPRSDVTITRDRATGVPHVVGTTRAGTMFGAGVAGAEDRLFVMDLLRHLGRGQLSSFAGGAPGNQALEQGVWRNSPYTEADLQAQVDALRQQGARGAQLFADMQSYIAGIDAYIAACQGASSCPGEYILSGHLGGPQPFVPADLVAIAGVVGGLFGGGGGAELQSALVRVAARARYGVTDGDRVWAALREQNDPEATLTLHSGQTFPYGAAPADTSGVALPDAGSVSIEPVAFDPIGSAGGPTAGSIAGALPGLTIGGAHQGMSNAVVVSGRNTVSGHPVAVFGPQTGYFSPQLLMLEELEGPGISARGAAFAGLNLYVQLGRGPDYAWSATSAEQDITDTFAVPLCTVDGTQPTVHADHYQFHGQCLPFETIERDNAWVPSLADPTGPGFYRLVALRSKYGLVSARGTVGGTPVAFTELRSTYRHDADSAIGFQMFDDPTQMASAAGFEQAAASVGDAFNWFYVNTGQSAYFNSGLNPVRSVAADPNLPVRAAPAYEWQGWNPDTNTARYTPPAQHPNDVGQDYYVNWNNKQAAGYSAADGNFSFGPVQRADLLDASVRSALRSGRKLDRAGVVRIVEGAASADLRAVRVLPELLRVLTSQPVTDPGLAALVARLQAWLAAGGHRQETSPGSHTYQFADAIQAFDAWWPLLVSAEFADGLGAGLFQALVDAIQINESPSGGQTGTVSDQPGSAAQGQGHKGSSFQFGWWGYVDKDIRALLGEPVAAPLPHAYWGGGSLAACRQVLLTSLQQAAAQPAATVYPGDANCAAGDGWCADAIVQSPLGGITDPLISWQNRPTYQQVVSFPSGRG